MGRETRGSYFPEPLDVEVVLGLDIVTKEELGNRCGGDEVRRREKELGVCLQGVLSELGGRDGENTGFGAWLGGGWLGRGGVGAWGRGY